MIFITGDAHMPIDVSKLNSRRFPEQKQMTKEDYLIICGDYGGVWDGSREEHYWREWLESKKFTTLFVDGNHENFTMLHSYKVIDFCGGKARRVSDSIYHLERGQIFQLQGVSVFTMGGADSRDRERRKEGKTWWSEELPSLEEIFCARHMLAQNSWRVDYVLTHCAPNSLQRQIAPSYPENRLTDFLEEVKQKAEYRAWYFGHYHTDLSVDDRHTAAFNRIHRIV